jgi:hypothetical protein
MRDLCVSLSEQRSTFSTVAVYLFDFVFPSASPFVSFLFGFPVTTFTVDEIMFIYVPRPLGSPSQYGRMKLAIASCFTSSPLSYVLLFREELGSGVTSPPDHVPDSRTALAIQTEGYKVSGQISHTLKNDDLRGKISGRHVQFATAENNNKI